jgi:hypothetical protein
MKVKVGFFVLAVIIGSALTFFQNCANTSQEGSSEAFSLSGTGPLDGNYQVNAWTCGPTDVLALLKKTGVVSGGMTIYDNNGLQALTYSDSCVAQQNLKFTYPSQGEIDAQLGSIGCSQTGCTPTECLAIPASGATMDFSYTQPTAASVVLTHTLSAADLNAVASVYANTGCTAGQILTITLQNSR